jgi:hypothetical protein
LAGDADRLIDDFEPSAWSLRLTDEECVAAGDAADGFAGELWTVGGFFATGWADDVRRNYSLSLKSLGSFAER